MSNPPLSVQLYTVREAVADDLPGALARIAAIGFEQVELYGFVARADEWAGALTDNGLSSPSAHAQLVGQDLDGVFAAAQKLGIGTVIDPHIDEERWGTLAGIRGIADFFAGAAATAAKYGITVGYHNHAFEFENRFDGVAGYEVFAGLIGDDVLLELDTYWAAVGGEDVPALLGRIGGKVKFLHIKDGPVNKNNTEQVAVGRGSMDVAAILAAAPDALRVVELDAFDGDVYTALADSYSYLTAGAGAPPAEQSAAQSAARTGASA